MKLLKLHETKKLFYKKYLYKLFISNELNTLFRADLQKSKNLSYAREKLDVRFYLVAVLFLVFDLELAFLIPWGINLRATSTYPAISNGAFVAMIVFLTVLFLGLIYGWKKGALEWE